MHYWLKSEVSETVQERTITYKCSWTVEGNHRHQRKPTRTLGEHEKLHQTTFHQTTDHGVFNAMPFLS